MALSAISAASAAACSKKIQPTSQAISSAVEATSTSASVSSSTIASTSSAVEATSTSASASSSTIASTSATAVSSPAASSVSKASSGSSGEATFYGGNLSGGTCSFTTLSTIPNSLYGTAFSGAMWDDAAECGACVEVTGPNGKTITAMIVDECPECEEGHFDLFENAFLELGTASEGIIDITYTMVSCGITSPIVLANKSGTSAYWFSMQVVNANEAVDSLEVSTDGGSTWQSTTRSSYNFFENSSGFGTATVDVRVTSTSGDVITVSGVSVASEAQATAASNFS
ncbi:RlpA-like double-psi beta-barrel-protein domain-containing protein-containing protein [Coniella lustricola]|uniref:RlpA-like double-psi beta-barrel-protein domain-containing protein-containing protein n=1 Tax=Coniella lustricola TaxID=2025994 RepID=A0A2T3A607_9PEZI|nr:RlpA-like double-psi beta-barrel-protein domain-containing protein-containing protein [Coniella lustricola]